MDMQGIQWVAFTTVPYQFLLQCASTVTPLVLQHLGAVPQNLDASLFQRFFGPCLQRIKVQISVEGQMQQIPDEVCVCQTYLNGGGSCHELNENIWAASQLLHDFGHRCEGHHLAVQFIGLAV